MFVTISSKMKSIGGLLFAKILQQLQHSPLEGSEGLPRENKWVLVLSNCAARVLSLTGWLRRWGNQVRLNDEEGNPEGPHLEHHGIRHLFQCFIDFCIVGLELGLVLFCSLDQH